MTTKPKPPARIWLQWDTQYPYQSTFSADGPIGGDGFTIEAEYVRTSELKAAQRTIKKLLASAARLKLENEALKFGVAFERARI